MENRVKFYDKNSDIARVYVHHAGFSQANSNRTATVVSQVGSPRIAVDLATIAGGRLVITGRAATVGQKIFIKSTTFSAVANTKRVFSFNVDFRTPDCRVYLATTTGTLGLMISGCGPVGVLAYRGQWLPAALYAANDIVFAHGASWIAKRANRNKQPGFSATALDWQPVAAPGKQGPAGVIGARGPAGPPGPIGPSGAPGPRGEMGPVGSCGTNGTNGTDGRAGCSGGYRPRRPDWTARA